jgi:hypothetical protein
LYSSLRGFARELAATLVRLAAYCGALAGMAYGLVTYAPHYVPVSSDAAAAPDVPQEWTDVDRPFPAFAVMAGEFEDSEIHYVIRRHPQGGRKDVITFGSVAGPGPHLLIEIYRAGAEQARFGGAAAEIAARVTDVDLERIKPAGTIMTKFGEFRLLDFAAESVSGLRQCLGFVRTFEDSPTQIAGTYCRAGPAIVDRGALVCALDRLTLMSAGSDGGIAELFASAEVKRSFCGPHTIARAATPKHASWIDEAREPTLRGRLAAQ